MKKVLFVATVTKHINTFHIPYLKWFKEQGYEVHVASKGNENIEYCDKHFEIPFERFPLKKQNIKAYKQLKNIIDENKYEIIHCHTPVGGVLTRLAARKARKKYNTKVIYTAHGFHFYKGAPIINWLVYYPIEKMCSRWTDCLITINKEDYELAKRKFKKCKEVEYIPGVGLETNRFDFYMSLEEKLSLKKKLGLKREDFVLCFPARLDKNKNQILLINMMEQLGKKYNNIHLLLPGIDERNGFYQEIVKNKNMDKIIHFLGKREDIPQILKITDIAVSSSIREGLGMNLIEALYLKVPVVAIDNRGHREIVVNGVNGYLIDNYTECREFADKVEALYLEKEKRESMGEEGKKYVEKFLLYNVLKKVEDIYFK